MNETGIVIDKDRIGHYAIFIVWDGEGTHKRLAGASVTLGKYGTQVTNTEGACIFYDVEPGSYPLKLEKVGYIRITSVFQMPNFNCDHLEFIMKKIGCELQVQFSEALMYEGIKQIQTGVDEFIGETLSDDVKRVVTDVKRVIAGFQKGEFPIPAILGLLNDVYAVSTDGKYAKAVTDIAEGGKKIGKSFAE